MSDVKELIARAELAERRVAKLADWIWSTRWATDPDYTDKQAYDEMVGMASAVRSGNFEPLDKELK